MNIAHENYVRQQRAAGRLRRPNLDDGLADLTAAMQRESKPTSEHNINQAIDELALSLSSGR
jgi:hypothetical protein